MKNLLFLELVKVLMYDVYISYIKKKYGDCVVICLIELIYNKIFIKKKYVYMKEDYYYFDVRLYFVRIY